MAGSYPAFYLSMFQPVHILKTNRTNRRNSLRSLLVILQFAISIILIISTLITRNQLEYIRNKDLGFNKAQLLTMNTSSGLEKQIKIFKQEIAKNPEIIGVTASSLMFQSGIPGNGFIFDNKINGDLTNCQLLDVDYDFLNTFGLKIKQGRFFSRDFSTDSSAVIINEAAMREFKSNDPIGKDLSKIDANAGGLKRFKIIGVVNDFNYESLHQKIRPLIFSLGKVKQASTEITIRIKSADMSGTIKYLENEWKGITGGEYFNLRILDENLRRLYENEERIGTINTVFTFMAVIIACLGLFGLISFLTEQKTKEIGIRKVLGASVAEIIVLLSKEIVKWVVIANLIAWPAAYYAMNNWLQNFAYRVEISWLVFVISGIIAIVIALLTVSYQAVKAAVSNPIESLRYE
jgi:putative ABC transport system permease protein